MITPQRYHGGHHVETISADKHIEPKRARVWVLTPTISGLFAVLPDARRFRKGGPICYIINRGSHALGLKDSAGNVVVTPDIPPGNWCMVGCVDNSTSYGQWSTRFKTFTRGS